MTKEIRRKIAEWANEASLEELMQKFPIRIELDLPTSSPARRVPKRIRRRMSKEEGEEIRQLFGELQPGTAEYSKLQKQVCRERGLTPTQVGQSLGWRSRKK